MTDIVERLLTQQMDCPKPEFDAFDKEALWAFSCEVSDTHWALRREAAAEIERLRAALREIAAGLKPLMGNSWYTGVDADPDLRPLHDRARAALERAP